ncbi:MAG: D-tyrosyl-tRNA(Tyr) deacylase [Nanoarchaeota archaeon]|nr:D-tyrosyl-tRNA(Tyr) deacylase [Nanoarchaeota archaeon]
MKVILQRVKSANVKVNSQVVGSCSRGYCLLVGISHEYNENKMDWMINKILSLKCFGDENSWGFTKNIQDIKGELLIISQFTLHARVNNGSKPDFSKSMKFDEAKEIFDTFVKKLKNKSNLKIETGKFGAQMEVELINEGPFTLILEK